MDISEDHPNPSSTPMWNLTSNDIHQIKRQLQACRARIDAKYAEDCKALDAELAELDTLERVAASVALKYRADDTPGTSEENSAKAGENDSAAEADVMLEAQAVAAPADNGGGPELKTASRWRLALRE
ncbi:MAG TPA: hypothetical protein VE687_18545 [Stellaceae bacterium]|nr:hypothetical protein [Stellaceae bacterium]